MFAWQVFDQKTVHLLRDEYRIPRTTKEKADTLEALAERLEGVDPKGFLDTVRAFNAAPRPDVPFNPNIHDGLRTAGLAIDKSNWAQRLDTPPYEAYAVTTGITFTFGGLKITNDAEVEDVDRPADPGPVRGRRDRRRALLPQLRQRHRADGRRRVRPHRREERGGLCAALADGAVARSVHAKSALRAAPPGQCRRADLTQRSIDLRSSLPCSTVRAKLTGAQRRRIGGRTPWLG